MSANITYLKRNDVYKVPSMNHSLQARNNENVFSRSTIHVNPLRTANKILVNKEKLNKGIRIKDFQPRVPTTEKIYYNPKFLSKHVQNATSSYVKSCSQLHIFQNRTINTLDSNIHINRNYLSSLNNDITSKPLNYTREEIPKDVSAISLGGIHINPKFIKSQKPIVTVEPDKIPASVQTSSLITRTSPYRSTSPMKKINNLKNSGVNIKSNIKLGVQSKSRYKLVKNVNSPLKLQIPLKTQIVSKSLCLKNVVPVKKINYLKSSGGNINKSNNKLGVQSKSRYKLVKNVNSPVESKSKYKLIKNVNSPPKILNPLKNQMVSKPLCFKTKYSLKRLSIGKERLSLKNAATSKFKTQFNTRIKAMKPCSEFKKLGRTKLVRKSVLQSMILARRSSRNIAFKTFLTNKTFYKKIVPKKKTANLTYFPKRNVQTPNNKCLSAVNNSFKRISKMKIVRKSLLKAQIEARNQVRKQYLLDLRTLKYNRKVFISKFKLRNDIIRRKYVDKQRSLLKWRKKKQGSDAPRIKNKKTNSSLPSSKSLRKNNQPCPFYNRFGRCKGKERGTCPKLHDSKYISICRKLLQGECNTKDCLLSHDIRPGKMPTCHHYLAGLCTRPNCPFLHIKVNPKAPICTSFLQGFCPDVFNCLKRHEFICPIFAEKGTCPRGKSCTYPHRSPVVHSKLLKDDQKPMLIHPSDSLLNSKLNSNNEVSEIADDEKTSSDFANNKRNLNTSKHRKKPKKEYVKETFTRYFAISANQTNDETCNNDELQLKEEDNIEVNVDEFR